MTVANQTNSIGPASAMREVLAVYPGAQRALFRKYHIGGCSSCGFQPGETLAEVCRRNNNLPVEEVIEQIKLAHLEDQKLWIEPAEAKRRLSSGEPLRFLDIRTREEFEAVHLAGAVLFSESILQEMLTRWDRRQPLVIYDHLGARSLDAAAYFRGHGFEAAQALRGGIDAWAREVDRTVPRYKLG